MYDRVKVAQEEEAKKTKQAKAESVLMNLLPCPFCGGIDLSCDSHYVMCDSCGANWARNSSCSKW